MTAPLKWTKAKKAVREIREMAEESAPWAHIRANGLRLENCGSLMFEVDCFARRDGPHLYAVKFHLMPGKQSRPIEQFLLGALLYHLHTERCTKLFGDESDKDPHSWRIVGAYWSKNSDDRLFKAVSRALENEGIAAWNPAIDQLAANVRAAISKLDKPIDMHIRDIIHPLKQAIKKGATREELVRLVDEAIAESVMKA